MPIGLFEDENYNVVCANCKKIVEIKDVYTCELCDEDSEDSCLWCPDCMEEYKIHLIEIRYPWYKNLKPGQMD